MSKANTILNYSSLPDELKQQVDDFIAFLKNKSEKEKPEKSKRKAGLAKGLIKMKGDFDEPLADFNDYMQ